MERKNKFMKVALIVAGLAIAATAVILLASGVKIPEWLFMCGFVGGLLLVCWSFFVGAPKREARRYVDENGKFDMDTPRSYTAMKVSGIQSFLASGSFLKRNRIEKFDYADGRVHILMANGDEISAPLSEIEMIVRKNPKDEGPTIYEVSHGSDKVLVIHNTAAFDELEVEDMQNILMRCSAVREPKSLKILSGINKVIGSAENIGGDTDMLGTFVEDKVSSMASTGDIRQIDDSEDASAEAPRPKKGGKIKRVILWTLGIIVAMFIALVIIGIVTDDDELTLEDFDAEKPTYLVGGINENLIVIPIKSDDHAVLQSESVTAVIPGYEKITFNVEEAGPTNYLLKAEGNPGVWGAQTIVLSSGQDEDNEVHLKGTFTDTDGAEGDLDFVIVQPKEGESCYAGTIGGQGAIFVLQFDNDTLSGRIITNDSDDVITIGGSLIRRDGYDGVYSISAPDMSMEVTVWSNGGEAGLTGYANTPEGQVKVEAEDLEIYTW